MAMRTTHHVRCDCGHSGTIRQIENDQPYSACYEAYSPVNLSGTRVEFTRPVGWPEILEAMVLRCYACDEKLTENSIVKQP